MSAPDGQRWTIDRTISANTMVQLVAMLAAVLGAYFGMKAEVAVVDQRVTGLSLRIDYEQAGDRRLFDDIRITLNRIEGKIDGKADKPGR